MSQEVTVRSRRGGDVIYATPLMNLHWNPWEEMRLTGEPYGSKLESCERTKDQNPYRGAFDRKNLGTGEKKIKGRGIGPGSGTGERISGRRG